MRFRKSNDSSLRRSGDLVFLALGSAVGIGNFLVLPRLFLGAGALSVLSAHVLSLLLLGAPLLVAEMVWGRWLLRPYQESFAVLGPGRRWFAVFAFLALIDICPPYIAELSRLAQLSFQAFFEKARFLAGFRQEIERSPLQSYTVGVGLLFLALLILSRPRRFLSGAMKFLVSYAFLAWIAVCGLILNVWGLRGFTHLLNWDYSRISFSEFLEIFAFSLFTLSAGFGVHFTFVYYASQQPWEAESQPFWKRPGNLVRTVAWVLAGDFLASVIALVFVSPFSAVGLSPSSARLPSSFMLVFDWLPQILSPLKGGVVWVALFMSGLLAAGFASVLSLLEFAVHSLEVELKCSRRRACALAGLIGLFLTALPQVAYFEHKMNLWGSEIFLPLSALALSLAVGWGMPVKAQVQILGRGPLLDGLTLMWRFSLRYMIPLFLVLYFSRHFFA